jgi:hypothetical protein
MMLADAPQTLATGKLAPRKPEVRLEPWPGDNARWPVRGRKRILVDDVAWGAIHMEGHGVHGVSYWFEQKGIQGAIQETKPSSSNSAKTYATTIKVRSGGRRARFDDEKLAPIDERLIDQVHELIKRGLLKHPDVVQQEQEAARARYQQRCAEEDAAARVGDLAKAHALIEEHAPGLNDREPLAGAIADLIAKVRAL